MRGYITDPVAPSGLRLADDLPEPDPAAGEAVVRVGAFAVNRGELHLLTQRADGWRPGQDLAGTVVGPAAEGGPAEGARVVAIADGLGWSERVAVPTGRMAVLPDGVGLEDAASLPIAGLTALRALRAHGELLGRRVLVTGATGGVGQFALQLARAAGANVTALVSGPEREQEARDLGAHRVAWSLDADDLGPFDLVLDAVGGPTLARALARSGPGATLVLYGTLGGPAEISLMDFASAPRSRMIGFFHAAPDEGGPSERRGADLATLAGLVADGRLRPRLGAVRAWEDLPEVLDDLRRRRVRGKAVLTVGY